jgi:hypothetical protein
VDFSNGKIWHLKILTGGKKATLFSRIKGELRAILKRNFNWRIEISRTTSFTQLAG